MKAVCYFSEPLTGSVKSLIAAAKTLCAHSIAEEVLAPFHATLSINIRAASDKLCSIISIFCSSAWGSTCEWHPLSYWLLCGAHGLLSDLGQTLFVNKTLYFFLAYTWQTESTTAQIFIRLRRPGILPCYYFQPAVGGLMDTLQTNRPS